MEIGIIDMSSLTLMWKYLIIKLFLQSLYDLLIESKTYSAKEQSSTEEPEIKWQH